jgi:hypothetical protein
MVDDTVMLACSVWRRPTILAAKQQLLAATQGVTYLGGDPTDLPGTWGSHNFLQV